MLSDTEQFIVEQLSSLLELEHIPIYRNGYIIKITGINDEDIYDQRDYAYNATVFISDEIVYNLDSVKSIDSITIPNFSENGDITLNLAYIIKMKACAENNCKTVSSLCFKAIELMMKSHISWQEKDYIQLMMHLYEIGDLKNAELFEKTIRKKIIKNINKVYRDNFKNALATAKSLGTDLLVPNFIEYSCEQCSMYQNRVYSISGNDKRFPALPKQVFIYGNFHEGCRHTFHPFVYNCSVFQIYSATDGMYITVDPIKYSNRPFVDERTYFAKQKYNEYIQSKEHEKKVEALQKEYYQKKAINPDSVPKSFYKYLNEKLSNK